MTDTETPLLVINRSDSLEFLEDVVDRGLRSFVEVSTALRRIRDGSLYPKSDKTFEAYVQRRFGFAKAYAYQLMGAGKVVEHVSAMADVPLPANERQARPLTALSPDAQREAWRTAVESAPDGVITGKHVQDVVERLARGEGASAILAGARAIRQDRRESNRRQRVEALAEACTPELGGDRVYPVILSDPPWRYASGTTDPSRTIENHYPSMPLEEIKALPVADVATRDAVLFLWATAPLLPEALEVMGAWGFAYKTGAVWDKERMGTGYWVRVQHEHLLIGVRGKPPLPSSSSLVSSVFRVRRGAHSEKPPAIHEMIDSYWPELPKLELFARAPRDGWDVWGKEADNNNDAREAS